MTLTLNITDDLKPDELQEVVEIAREEQRPIGQVLLTAARALARMRRERQSATLTTSAAAEPVNATQA